MTTLLRLVIDGSGLSRRKAFAAIREGRVTRGREELRASGLHTVGRLDRDTSGLLLLTNDGALTFRLTHPKHAVEKEYWLRTEPLSPQQLAALRRGVKLDSAVRRPLRLELLADAEPFEVAVTLQEGRNRQVRRMVEAVGSKVMLLRR